MRSIPAMARVLALVFVLPLSGCLSSGVFGPKPPLIPGPGELHSAYTNMNTMTGPPAEYVGAGYAEVYKSCGDYFDNLILAQNVAGFTGDVARGVGTTGVTIAALRQNAALAQREIIKWSAGTALVGTIIDSYNDRALMTPYPSETKTLILRALTTYEERNPPRAADTRPEALSFVAAYAEMCTYSGVTRFAKQALANAEPKPAPGNTPTSSAADQGYLKAVATTLGDPAAQLNLRQAALLHYHLVGSPTWDESKPEEVAHRKALISELPETVKGNFLNQKEPKKTAQVPSVEALKLLLGAFSGNSAELRREIETVKVAMATPTNQVETLVRGEGPGAQKAPILVFPPSSTSTPTVRQEVRF